MSETSPSTFDRGVLSVSIGALAALTLFVPSRAAGQNLLDPIHALTVSYETWTTPDGVPLADEEATRVTHGTVFSRPNLGPIPAGADLDALAEAGNGVYWFSLADWAELSGGVRAHPGDVIQWNGVSYTKVFDLLGCGWPAGLNVDAIDVSIFGNNTLLISFDTTVLWLGSFFVVKVLFDEGYTTMTAFTCSFGDFTFSLPDMVRRLDLDGLSFAARWGDTSRFEPYASFDTWASLGTSVNGPAHVAYRRDDGMWQGPTYSGQVPNLPTRDLDALVVHRAGLFADDFATGGSGRWSETVP